MSSTFSGCDQDFSDLSARAAGCERMPPRRRSGVEPRGNSKVLAHCVLRMKQALAHLPHVKSRGSKGNRRRPKMKVVPKKTKMTSIKSGVGGKIGQKTLILDLNSEIWRPINSAGIVISAN